ncbi:HK97 gp10 family phage protein [Nocardioides rotundus]|uniref:HK97-gp10 family putative phage morphogenesis protein n=1 Tax=Nocardioides rotundus TaxID=1774216 RepID=UPI001CBA8C7E|nr:HK97-gp10 family putative phage morphogenesis protein [Nocardioides rotundus]UAL31547.1 HK97 gp10 family phage protein [Nocardioides rotundus]
MGARLDQSQLERFAVDLHAAGSRADVRLGQAVRRFVFEVEAAAKVTAPVDTGALRSSIGGASKTGVGRHVGAVDATVGYAGFVEYGTSTQAPQPFLGPAFDGAVPGLVQAALRIGAEAIQ